MPRLFRYSSLSYDPLRKNELHDFAQRHALSIYVSDTVYSFIPKNACSTMRTSLAYANGCISGSEDFNWIHKNNQTFSATLSELVKAKYTFVILRCPFKRLTSVYLDKIVGRDLVAWNLADLLQRRISVAELSFSRFVKNLIESPVSQGDIHWRPQVDFLVYKTYDDYFALENFPQAISTLKAKIDLDVIDARNLTKHGTDQYTPITEGCFADALPLDILQLQTQGKCPAPAALYTPELKQTVQELYAEDIALYRSVIGPDGLLFDV